MMMKILHLSQNKKKYLMDLQMKGLKKITNLDERVNGDDLIYRYEGTTDNVKFDEFNNALDIVNKKRDGKTELADVENNQQKFKYFLGKIKKVVKNQKSKKALCTILKCSIMQETRLLNFMMIILQ